MSTVTISEWFCLKSGRSNFRIHPSKDADLYFERADLYPKIQREVRKAFVEGKVPKLVLWGDWGIGKTHTMYHIKYFLETHAQQFPSKVYFLECSDMEKNTRFNLLHHEILDSISMEYIVELLEGLQAKHQKKIKECLKLYLASSDAVNAFASLMGGGQSAQLAWNWLNGIELNSAERTNIPVTENLKNSKDLVDVLKFVGDLHREVESKTLLLLIDEVEKISRVKNDDAVDHWTHAFKALADSGNQSVGFILGTSFRSLDELETLPALMDTQVRSRLGDHSYIEMPNFLQADTEAFLKDIFGKLIDSACAAKKVATDKEAKKDFKPEVYPFTQDAFHKFVDHFTKEPDKAVPRLIIENLDDLAFDAFEEHKLLIDEATIDRLGLD